MSRLLSRAAGKSFGAALGILGALAFCRAAEAKTAIAGDLDYAIPIDSSVDPGGGFGIRLGQQLHLPFVVFTPEIGFNYHSFSDVASPKVYRGIGGIRLGFGEILRAGVFGHLGLARVTLDTVPDLSHTAFTYDAGVFFDFTALPLLDIGVHAAYNRVAADDAVSAFQYGTLGAHAALIF